MSIQYDLQRVQIGGQVSMKVYDTGSIRNVVLLGHGGAGKTTVAESLCYVTHAINRLGSVDEGNTISDFDKEEKHSSDRVQGRRRGTEDQSSGYTGLF